MKIRIFKESSKDPSALDPKGLGSLLGLNSKMKLIVKGVKEINSKKVNNNTFNKKVKDLKNESETLLKNLEKVKEQVKHLGESFLDIKTFEEKEKEIVRKNNSISKGLENLKNEVKETEYNLSSSHKKDIDAIHSKISSFHKEYENFQKKIQNDILETEKTKLNSATFKEDSEKKDLRFNEIEKKIKGASNTLESIKNFLDTYKNEIAKIYKLENTIREVQINSTNPSHSRIVNALSEGKVVTMGKPINVSANPSIEKTIQQGVIYYNIKLDKFRKCTSQGWEDL